MSTWTAKLQQYPPSSIHSKDDIKLIPVTNFLEPGDSYMIKTIECNTPFEEAKARSEGQVAIDNPHPRICRCFEVKCEPKLNGGSYVYLRLERMPLSFFQDIETRSKNVLFYTESELWRILREAMAVYTFLQQRVTSTQNIAHRDIKPGNILFDSDRHVKVCDLGFLKTINPDNPDLHTVLGTDPYLSPELRKAFINNEPLVQHDLFKSDVYSLGMTMLHAALLELPPVLTNRKDLEVNLSETMRKMQYSQQWESILSRMLIVEEDDRPDFVALTAEIRRELMYSECEPISNIGFESVDITTPLLISAKCGTEYVRVGLKRFEEVPCMVSLHAIDTRKDARSYAVDFVCVIDESGSMDSTKMKLVKDTLSKIVHFLKETDRMCLITFSDSAELRCPLVPCDSPGKKKLLAVIQQLAGRYNTNITAGLLLAADVMEQRLFPNTGAAILLFSDGQHNVSDLPLPACRERIQGPALQAGRVQINTFGYGEDSDSTLLVAIAEEGKGVFRLLNASRDIEPAFALAFAELVTIVANDVEVRLEELPGPVSFTIEKVYSKDGAPHFQIPAIIANQSKDLVFFIKAPYMTLHNPTVPFPAVRVTVTYTDRNANQQQTLTIQKDVVVKCEPWVGAARPGTSTSVFANWYRVKGASALQEAKEIATRSPSDAVLRLRNAEKSIDASHFESLPVVQSVLSDIRLMISQLEATHHLDRTLAAQLQMISYSHFSQVGTGPQSFYRSPQQSEVVQAMSRMPTTDEVSSEDDSSP